MSPEMQILQFRKEGRYSISKTGSERATKDLLKADLAEAFGVVENPKLDALFGKCWERGRTSREDLIEVVVGNFSDLVELIK